MKKVLGKLHRFFCGKFHLAVLDEMKGRWSVAPEAANIAYLKAENANGRHILMQPLCKVEPFYLMADDISHKLIARHHQYGLGKWKSGRMVVETSPNNFQVWIHSSRYLPVQEKRFWLERMCSDPGADPCNRWGRCPGFRNRKKKYDNGTGTYPLAKLIWVDWKNKVDIPVPHQPLEGDVCHQKAISRSDYDRGNSSVTDFSYALALARRGYGEKEIRTRLQNERADWSNHQGNKRREAYLDRTIGKVMEIL